MKWYKKFLVAAVWIFYTGILIPHQATAGDSHETVYYLEQKWMVPFKDANRLVLFPVDWRDVSFVGVTGNDQTISLVSETGEIAGKILLSLKPGILKIGRIFGSNNSQLINADPLGNRLDIMNMEGFSVGKHVSHGRIQEYVPCDVDGDGFSEIVIGTRTKPGLYVYKHPGVILWRVDTMEDIQRLQTTGQDRALVIQALGNQGFIETYDGKGRNLKQYSAPVYLDDFCVIQENDQFKGLIAVGESPEKVLYLFYFSSKGFIRWEKRLPSSIPATVPKMVAGDVTGNWSNSLLLVFETGELVIFDTEGTLIAEKKFNAGIKDIILANIDRDNQQEIIILLEGKGVIALDCADRMQSRKTVENNDDVDQSGYAEFPAKFWTALEYLDMGNRLFRIDKLQPSLEAYRKAVIMNPDLAISYANMAIALIGMEQLNDAETFCKKAISLNPYLPDAPAYLGIIQYQRGNLDRSISLNLKAAALCQSKRNISTYSLMDLGSVYYNLGCAYALQNNINQALNYLDKAFRLNPALRDSAGSDDDLAVLKGNNGFDKVTTEPEE